MARACRFCPHISFFFAVIVCSAAAVETSPQKSPFFFIIDYLPAAIYDRDSVTGCFRVENTSSSEAKLEFVFATYNEDGSVLKENSQTISAAPNTFTSFQGTLDSRLASRITFVLRKGNDPVGSVALRLLRDDAAWPATKWSAGRLTFKDNGDVLLATIAKRVRKLDRAFAPMKWMLGNGEKPGERKAQPSVVFVPGRWFSDQKARQAPTCLGPYELKGAPPILMAADQILSRAPGLLDEDKSHESQLVLCLPPEDFDAATDPRVYRTVLDGLLARVMRTQAKKVFIVPPFHYGVREKAAQTLWQEVNLASAAYGAIPVDPADYLSEKLWRVDPEIEGVYGLKPNAEGLKKIEQGLFNLIP